MSRDLNVDEWLEEDDFDDFGELDEENEVEEQKNVVQPIHRDHWTIVDALNTIYEYMPRCRLENYFLVRCAEAFAFLSDLLGFNPVQCTVIAMLVEDGQSMSYRQMGKALGLSRLSMMTHYNDIEDLFKRRWLQHCGAMEPGGMFEGYRLCRGVVSAIRENRPFVPEVLECADTQEFVEKLAGHLETGFNDDDMNFKDDRVWIMDLIEANKNLRICQETLKLKSNDSMMLLMLLVGDYCNFNGSPQEGIGPREVQLVFPRDNKRVFTRIVSKLQNGTQELFESGLMEHKCEDGMANVDKYVATAYLKNEVLADFIPIDCSPKSAARMSGLKSCKEIVAKNLFYNEKEGEQVHRLQNLLSQEQLPLVQERLQKKGMRTGVCILMHGAPGTGKTATAYELARQTGRDIIQVQVTDFKDKYVGESEAKLKKIFGNYRQCCRNSEVAPILLLNEGDAILSKRTTNVEQSVDQMNNALQNILLEEMENLEGIMIVTTNLIVNLDSAFERRFIFKIQFDKPGKEVKARIWKSMIEELDEKDTLELADMFDISGGEIENIARKTIMEYALTGLTPDLQMVKSFAKEEKLMPSNTRTRVIGFNTLS